MVSMKLWKAEGVFVCVGIGLKSHDLDFSEVNLGS